MQTIEDHVRRAVQRMRARPVVPHPSLASVERANAAFARRFALVEGEAGLEKFLGIRSASCAAHAYVGMPEPVVSLAADLIGWMFLFDDRYGEGKPGDDMHALMARFASYEAVMLGGILPIDATPFHAALGDLRDRGAALGGDVWLRRWVAAMARYFDGCVLELPYRRDAVSPSLADYRRLRSWTVGTMVCFHVSELGIARCLSEREAADPAMQRANELAAMLTAWVNDVYSQPKERHAGDPLNLVSVLAHEREISIDHAFVVAAELYNEDLEAFGSLQQRLRLEARSSAVPEYLDALLNWIHGNHAWTGLCRRYHHATEA